MVRKDKKQKHEKKRQKERKRQKARVQSQPKLYRKDPAAGDLTLIPCDLSLVNDLVYGGIFWARK
jgi:hypothetical protein